MAHTAARAAALTILPIDTQTARYKWLVASIVLLASATQIFAGTSLNLAIPRLMVTFGTDLSTTQWVATGFLITRTLVIPMLGWLGSALGNRNLFVTIMIGFVVTSIGCGLATSLPMLVCFRLLQGAVMGPMEGLTAVILVQAFPARQRGLALGLRTIGWATGELVFYTVGGYLFEHISWRLLFFLGLPSGVATIILGLLLLPQQPEARAPSMDYLGILCLGGFLVPLLLAISFGRNSDTSTASLVALGGAACIGGVLFVVREWRVAFPAVDLRLFQKLDFCLICSTAFFNSMGLFGALFMVPIFLQQVMGLTPLQAGLVILPALPISGLSGVLTGRLTDLVSPPLVALGGLLVLTVIFQSLASVTALTTLTALVGYMMCYRAFMDSVGIPITALTMQVLETEHIRMGQGLVGVMRSIGASFGVTVISVFFEWRRELYQLMAYATYDSASVMHQTAVNELHLLLGQAGVLGSTADEAALGAIRQQMDVEAIAVGFRDSFFLICVCFLVAMIPMLCLLRHRLRLPHLAAP